MKFKVLMDGIGLKEVEAEDNAGVSQATSEIFD